MSPQLIVPQHDGGRETLLWLMSGGRGMGGQSSIGTEVLWGYLQERLLWAVYMGLE